MKQKLLPQLFGLRVGFDAGHGQRNKHLKPGFETAQPFLDVEIDLSLIHAGSLVFNLVNGNSQFNAGCAPHPYTTVTA